MIILYDARLPEEYKAALKWMLPDVGLVPVPVSCSVYDSIASHPDIYFCQLDERTLVYAPCIRSEVLDVLRESGAELIPGKNGPEGAYPATARYNAVRSGDFFLHNLQYTDPAILSSAEKMGLRAIDVPQGYARCSTLPVSDDAIITSDEGVAASIRFSGLEVLLIKPGSVILPGQEYGFIGGAGGVTPGGTVIFLGDLDLHDEGGRIKAFLSSRNITYITLKGLPLYDAGSLIIL